MKVAIFRNDLTVVDINRYNSQELGLARGLHEIGHSVDIFTISGSSERHVSVIESGKQTIRFIFLPYFRIPILEAPIFYGLRHELKSGNYDLVQINDEGSIASYLIARACVHYNVPFVIYQGMYKLLSGRSRLVYEHIHRMFFRPFLISSANKVFAKTTSAQCFLAAKGFKNISVMPIGVDLTVFNKPVEMDWKKSHNIDPDLILLLYVGVLEDRRRPDLLIELLNALGAGYHLIIVGAGPRSVEIREKIDAEKIPNITILGQLEQSQLPSLYSQGDCLLFPSTFEIYGMVVLEALSFGVPVVSSDTAGPSDILSDEKFGMLVSGFEVSNWVAAVCDVLSKKNDFSVREYRIKEIKTKYSWSYIAKKYTELVAL